MIMNQGKSYNTNCKTRAKIFIRGEKKCLSSDKEDVGKFWLICRRQ